MAVLEAMSAGQVILSHLVHFLLTPSSLTSDFLYGCPQMGLKETVHSGKFCRLWACRFVGFVGFQHVSFYGNTTCCPHQNSWTKSFDARITPIWVVYPRWSFNHSHTWVMSLSYDQNSNRQITLICVQKYGINQHQFFHYLNFC